jgi:hypothetical protein
MFYYTWFSDFYATHHETAELPDRHRFLTQHLVLATVPRFSPQATRPDSVRSLSCRVTRATGLHCIESKLPHCQLGVALDHFGNFSSRMSRVAFRPEANPNSTITLRSLNIRNRPSKKLRTCEGNLCRDLQTIKASCSFSNIALTDRRFSHPHKETLGRNWGKLDTANALTVLKLT